MDVGVFMMPSHPPERDLRVGFEWDLEHIALCDRLGFSEAWIGEHFTAPWEPNPAPDILIAQALLRTKNIKLAPGAHLLPYHHPAELAHRVAFMDHLAQGRFMFGVGAGGLPSDYRLFNVDGMGGENRHMTREALDIILKLWTSDEPFEYRGKYWNVNGIEPMFDGRLKMHIKPLQQPHPPIGIAGLSPRSDTLEMAGEMGLMPLSLNLSQEYLRDHWASVERGAERGKRRADRRDWRVVREVYIAETDAEARKLALNGMIGRAYREYLLPLFSQFRLLSVFKHDPSVPDSDVTPEYLCEHSWLVGSPKTVASKLAEMEHEAGGFGTLLVINFDFLDEYSSWSASQQALMEEVMPQFRTRAAA
ncbi:MAG: LLM class flavin-dependent oxidoreductase [Gammaproteobacteria bacterium]|nr:LLM class flavin-dependent oxidoreductase [Gammaproteobacteria bacterium]